MAMKKHTLQSILLPLARKLRQGTGDPSLLFNAAVEAGYLVSASDGKVDGEEHAELVSIISGLSEGELDEDDVGQLLQDFEENRVGQGHEKRCKVVGDILARNHLAAHGVKLAAAIGWASGGLDKTELETLKIIAGAAHMSHDAVDLLTLEMRPSAHH